MYEKKRDLRIEDDIILIRKEVGETMGELLERAREECALSAETKITFAGRLDPLATGLVILLKDSMRFRKDEFLSLPKKYIFDVYFSVTTDTGDVLGLVTKSDIDSVREETLVISKLESVCSEFTGIYEQTYPFFSSKPVEGKPLFVHAKAKRQLELPTKEIEIKELNLMSVQTHNTEDFLNEINEVVKSVSGDFRQDEILKTWKTVFKPKTTIQ